MTTIALIGNPNAGKSTIFNYYTGARQHVGNYPGITVACREGKCSRKDREVEILDLPGTYSFTPYSPEEQVARHALLKTHVDVAICILDASALERNLYLVVQLQEMGVPFVIALNMMDEAERNGISIQYEELSSKLDVPVIPVIAREGKNLEELLQVAIKQATVKTKPLSISYGHSVNPVLSTIEALVHEESFLTTRYNPRFVAIKYAEGDSDIIAEGEQLNPKLSKKIQAMVQEVEESVRRKHGVCLETIISDYRYGYINSLIKGNNIITCSSINKRHNVTDTLDSILTHRFIGPLLMFAVLFVVYKITFALGEYPQSLLENFFELLSGYIEGALPDGPLKSLLVSGVIGGMGGILSFVPLVFLVFLQISFLEDSGYMARIAYMTDRVFKFFGLHGYSAMPLIISGGIAGGCAVPGIMATRTLRSPKEKLATILATPYMACGAKLPVFILFAGIFFSKNQAEVLFLLTLAGWLFALLASLLLRRTVIKGEAAPFIMELPPYRWPTLFGMFIHSFERIIEYIKKAGTFILAASILVWGMLTFPLLPESIETKYTQELTQIEENKALSDTEKTERTNTVEKKLTEHRLSYSFIGKLGSVLEPITRPLGFTWKENIALLGGLAAKELTISTLGIVYSLGEINEENEESLATQIKNDPTWSNNTVWAFLFFVLLYAPCITTLAIMKQETDSYKWVLFSLFSNTVIAYIVALLLHKLL